MLSREEYIKELEIAKQKSELEQRKPRYKCPKCGGGMCYDPNQYPWKCSIDLLSSNS